MIVCGWCGQSTLPESCSSCGRDPALPWHQRAQEPPQAEHREAGRPPLDPGQIKQKLRIARKELGADATDADLAELLGVSPRTLDRWQKVAD